jgi:RNA polymerase sigma factor (sigma-70 family)
MMGKENTEGEGLGPPLISGDVLPGEPHPLPLNQETGEWATMELLRKVHIGDEPSVHELVERYYPRLLRVVRLRLGGQSVDGSSAEDVVNETITKWLEFIRYNKFNFEPEHRGSLIAWLDRIARNKIKDLRDRQRNRTQGSYSLNSSMPDGEGAALEPRSMEPGPATDNEEADWKRHLKELFDALVAELPERDRELIVLHSYYGRPWSDIVAQLGYPNEHAGQEALGRVRRKLKKKLGVEQTDANAEVPQALRGTWFVGFQPKYEGAESGYLKLDAKTAEVQVKGKQVGSTFQCIWSTNQFDATEVKLRNKEGHLFRLMGSSGLGLPSSAPMGQIFPDGDEEVDQITVKFGSKQ